MASISTRNSQFAHWTSPVIVTVRNRDGQLDVVGIARPTGYSATTFGSARVDAVATR